MSVRAVVVVSLALTALAPASRAVAEEPSARQFVGGAVDRARRAISIGPIAGVGGAYAPPPDAFDVPLTFGIALVLFDIPIAPGPAAIEEMIASRTKAKLATRVAAIVATGQPPPVEQDLARIGAEVLAEVKAEILGQRPYRGRVLERPRFSLAFEGAYLPRADAWQARATAGVGIKRITIGPTIAGSFADANGLYLGGELAAHLTPWSGPRAHVVDVFLRVDVGVTDSTEDAHQLGLGARFLLDLI